MEDSSQQLPMVFGRYLLLKRMSCGGMGEIFLAKAGDVRGFEKLHIIKKILPHLCHDEAFVKRFTEEAQLAIKLNHINIAPVFEVGMVDDNLFLALEFVDGRDLRRVLSQCHGLGISVPQDIALFMAKEVANGLAYAHRRTDESGKALNLVHCDISPPNVLVSFEGEVKIIDFGVARSALQFHDNEPSTGFGKLGYMAPEQLLKGRSVDRRTDLYALGVVLYEMLVGDRMLALDAKADHKLNVRKIVLDPVPPPSSRVLGLDPRLDDIALKSVAKDPKDRFQDATELRTQIQRVLADINPTLSPDDVGHFLRETFIEELENDQSSLKEAHAMDLAPFMDQLNDAGEATVSYAVTNMWELPIPPVDSNVAAEVLSDSQLLSQERSGGVSGWVWAAIGGGVALVLLVLALVLFWPAEKDKFSHMARSKSQGEVAANSVPDAGGAGPKIIMEEPDGAVDEPPPDEHPHRQRNRSTNTSDRARRVRRRHGRVTRRRGLGRSRDRARNRGGMGSGMEPEDPNKVDPKAVLRKYQRVKSKYRRFKSKYGGRLESSWQAILSAAVYSGAGKYKRLDKMLNRLLRKMRAVEKNNE